MPRFCGVIKCSNTGSKVKKRFFRIPAELNRGTTLKMKLSRLRRKKWLTALNRQDLTETKIKYMWVCEDHFVNGQPSALEDQDHVDWAPSVKMGYKKRRHVTPVTGVEYITEISDESFDCSPPSFRKFSKKLKGKMQRKSSALNEYTCVISTCPNHVPKYVQDETVAYYPFPRNLYFQQLWLNFCQIEEDLDVPTIRICSLHFQPTAYRRDFGHELMGWRPIKKRELLEDAVPTLNSPLDAECQITSDEVRDLLQDVANSLQPVTSHFPIITKVVSKPKLKSTDAKVQKPKSAYKKKLPRKRKMFNYTSEDTDEEMSMIKVKLEAPDTSYPAFDDEAVAESASSTKLQEFKLENNSQNLIILKKYSDENVSENDSYELYNEAMPDNDAVLAALNSNYISVPDTVISVTANMSSAEESIEDESLSIF